MLHAPPVEEVVVVVVGAPHLLVVVCPAEWLAAR